MDDLYQRRAPRGYQKGACPGCGEGTIYPKGGVCQNCRADLDRMAQIREEQKAKADERVYATKERAYSFPGLTMETRQGGEFHGPGTISEPLWRLHQLTSKPATEGFHYEEEKARGDDAFVYEPSKNYSSSHEWVAYRIFPVAVADALRDLHKGIVESLKHAENEGHKRGRSLLMGLASGSITNDEFNRTAARMGGDEDQS